MARAHSRLGAERVWVVRTLRKERLFVEEATAAPQVRLGAGGEAVLEGAAASARPDVTIVPRRHAHCSRARLDATRHRRASRPSDRGRLPAGHLWLGPDLRRQRRRAPLARRRRGTGDARAARPRSEHAHGVLGASRRPGVDLADAGRGRPRGCGSWRGRRPSIRNVVVVGNGIAGITAADSVRRRHPDCSIDVVARERYHLYNRMAITRLIYGGSAMQGLFLMQDRWYERHRINTWLNTQVIAIDSEQRQVRLGTGQTLAYDRLILTAGSKNFVPPIEGFGAGGSFVLREAEDAMHIRAYVQERRCQRAAIAGGGLLRARGRVRAQEARPARDGARDGRQAPAPSA